VYQRVTYDPDKHHRHSIRLRNYDYSQAGGYFITLCTQGRECLFGEIVSAEMRLSKYGQTVQDEWLPTAAIRHEVKLDVFQIMPNHFHGIVIITPQVGVPGSVGAHGRAPLHRGPRSLGSLVAGFKSVVTRRINEMRNTAVAPVWQRNYYEHIIRSKNELDRIRQYILDNPAKWLEDVENPQNIETSSR
jgi:REP element-mobilizing transposase RayT